MLGVGFGPLRVHSRPNWVVRVRSAQPPRTDMQRLRRHVSFVPTGNIVLCGELWRNNHTRMKSSFDAVPGLIQPRFRPHCGSGLAWDVNWGVQHVFHRWCEEFLTWPLKQILPLTRSPSRTLVSGTSFNCLPSFSGRRCLRPALSHPLSPGIPNLLAAADRRRCNMIERLHSSPTGGSHPRKSIPRLHGPTTRPRHRLPRRELPASTQRGNRPRAAKSSIRRT